MNNTQAQAGGSTDLLSSILGVTVKNEEKITEQDRAYCQTQQEQLYESLDRLDHWYAVFKAEADKYSENRKVTYAANGGIEHEYIYYRFHSTRRTDYTPFEFLPFKELNKIVELRFKAVSAFAYDIISYFNSTYGISVDIPCMDAKTLPVGFRPVYESYVDHVIAHLGGKGFRETAEEELIARLHKVLMPYSRDNFKAELKGDKIVIPNILCFSNYSWDNTLQLTGSSERDLNDLCAGIIFSMTESLNGGINYLVGFDRENVDVSRWYNLISGPVSVKLFKNCRLDVKFKDAGAAGRC